jgi:fumarate reductase subunit C
MTAALFLAQRISAMVLALAVAVHLATILYATRDGLTAADILARTHGNLGFFLFYSVFVAAVAFHAPIGLRNVIREWTPWRGPTLDVVLAMFAVGLLVLGMRAVIAVYVA